jgi:hypothetical protein
VIRGSWQRLPTGTRYAYLRPDKARVLKCAAGVDLKLSAKCDFVDVRSSQWWTDTPAIDSA